MTKPKMKSRYADVPYYYDIPLSQFIESLQKLVGPENRTVNIEGDSNYNIEVNVSWYSEETEEDRIKTKEQEKKNLEAKRAHFEWLKKELGEA